MLTNTGDRDLKKRGLKISIVWGIVQEILDFVVLMLVVTQSP